MDTNQLKMGFNSLIILSLRYIENIVAITPKIIKSLLVPLISCNSQDKCLFWESKSLISFSNCSTGQFRHFSFSLTISMVFVTICGGRSSKDLILQAKVVFFLWVWSRFIFKLRFSSFNLLMFIILL